MSAGFDDNKNIFIEFMRPLTPLAIQCTYAKNEGKSARIAASCYCSTLFGPRRIKIP